jgi:hypothetical protein
MQKEFVPYELSLELKQLGFDEPCLAYYHEGGILINYLPMSKNKGLMTILNRCSAPLYSQAFRWFRETYKVRFFIQSGMSDLGEFFKVIFPDGEQRGMSYTTYEEAELACLQKLIEIVKTK